MVLYKTSSLVTLITLNPISPSIAVRNSSFAICCCSVW